MTEKPNERTEDDLLNRAVQAFNSGGLDALVASLESMEDPIRAGRAFDAVSRNLYRARKDVSNMIGVAGAGIAFCLDHAERANDAESVRTLKTIAKTTAFNAAANCWPGWGDEGIKIVPDQIDQGLKLAEFSRNLVRELQLGEKPEANGTWLIGALKLAAGEPVAALGHFQAVHSAAESRGDTVSALMAAGYCALARKAQAAKAPAGGRELEVAVARLREFDLKEAAFFANQLVKADQIFFAT
jgi:hypothetical protein